MADPSVNADTGERQNPAGWSVDDPSVLGGSALRKGMGLIEERQKVGDEEVKALEAKQKAEKPYQDKLKGILDSPITAHAELQKLQKAPNPEDYKKYTMEFLGAMTLVGAFASRKSRNVGNAALKAFTGAMTGWQQGNLEAYAQATKQWEENTKAVIENNRVELERYREIIENRSLNIEQLKAGLLVAGMESQNAIMVQQLKQGNLDAALKGIDMLTNMQTKLQNAVDPLTGLVTNQRTELAARVTDLNEHPERLANVKYDDFIRVKAAADAYHKIDPSFPQLKDPGANAQFGGVGGPPMTVDTARRIAEQVIAGDTTARQNIGRGIQTAADLRLINEQITQIAAERGMSGADLAQAQADFQGEKSAARTLGTYGAKLSQAGKAVDLFADQALQASQALPRGSFVPATKAIQAYQANTSNPQLYDLGFALFSLVNAYARAINPQGVPRISDKEHAEQYLSTATSPEALAKVIARLKLEVQAEQQATEAAKHEGRGGGTAPTMPRRTPTTNQPGWSVEEVQ